MCPTWGGSRSAGGSGITEGSCGSRFGLSVPESGTRSYSARMSAMANGTAGSESRGEQRGLQAAARSPVRLIRHHGLMITSLILLMSLTAPFTLGDTNVYVSHILLYYGTSPLGSNSLLWEFGHLLWRPLGWLLLEASAPALGGLFHRNIGLLCTAILIFINVAAGLVTVLVWESMVLRTTGSRAIAYGLALAFACANAFRRPPAPRA